MEKPKIFIHQWPGGISTLAGGARTVIKLHRPWQKQLNSDHTTCPFEPSRLKDEGRQIIECSSDGRWVSFDNRFTPNMDHSLVIPVTCQDWSDARVRLLGGKEEILAALNLIYKVLETKPKHEVTEIIINVGWLGGQNVGHLHWHVFGLPVGAVSASSDQVAMSLGQLNNLDLTLFEQNGLQVVVGGHRAGQCFILPKEKNISVQSIATVIADLVALYADKFQGSVGERLAPDFTIGLVHNKGNFVYGTYVPILNNWGGFEYLAFIGQQPVSLPWPHDQTAAYLRGEIFS